MPERDDALRSSRIRSILEALAVGDALGMPTEFMTRRAIEKEFGFVESIIDPSKSQNHSQLHYAEVTDDTEQNFALIGEYCQKKRISAADTAERLLRWARESGAAEKRYIGPSSLRALTAIEAGTDPAQSGLMGTTCGGVMRTPAAVLCASSAGWPLEDAVLQCCMPTHNTSPALEAAMAYAYALRVALSGSSLEVVLDEAVRGAAVGRQAAPYEMCAPSVADRIRFLRRRAVGSGSRETELEFIYGVIGTGLESPEVASAVFAILMYAREDAWLGIRMGASVGGDTDTIAALVGVLCTAVAGRHNIPGDVVENVMRKNRLDLDSLIEGLESLGGHDQGPSSAKQQE